ncbi:MAG: hypothetical protein M3O70_08765 [Actinomycetota bacterium]|nr:hypothetical protein [Actinomycetota bacterium]
MSRIGHITGLNPDQVEHVASAVRRAYMSGELGDRDLGLMRWGHNVAVVALRAAHESWLAAAMEGDCLRAESKELRDALRGVEGVVKAAREVSAHLDVDAHGCLYCGYKPGHFEDCPFVRLRDALRALKLSRYKWVGTDRFHYGLVADDDHENEAFS